MAIQIMGKSPQLTLFFDRSTARLSRKNMELLGQTLSDVEGVESVQVRRVWYGCQSLTVQFDPNDEPNSILRKMARALRKVDGNSSGKDDDASGQNSTGCPFPLLSSTAAPAESAATQGFHGLDVASSGYLRSVQRLRELSYAVLTLGCFGMSWVGLVVPGIPTVPFVLLTAHFGLQASPRLRRSLLRSRMFGQMMRDWQAHRAIRRNVQLQAYFFTTLIVVAGFLTSPPIPILYGVMLVGSFFGFYAVSKIPVLEQDGTIRRNRRTTAVQLSLSPAVGTV
ncbi:DUF454 family protein [Schlesneria sp. T3-172]|uniref:DUF454 family protein n=1 Tax=Schlesneria sphaerica TaxID=3373610 RepID=UPI0037C602E3